jgi:hypothetical protein
MLRLSVVSISIKTPGVKINTERAPAVYVAKYVWLVLGGCLSVWVTRDRALPSCSPATIKSPPSVRLAE